MPFLREKEDGDPLKKLRGWDGHLNPGSEQEPGYTIWDELPALPERRFGEWPPGRVITVDDIAELQYYQPAHYHYHHRATHYEITTIDTWEDED